jgi:ABC-type phosphate transport system substrate-binding protein
VEKVLSQALLGEMIATNRGYYSDPDDDSANVIDYVATNGDAIAYTSFAPYNNNINLLYAAAVQDPDDGVYRFPTFDQFSTGEYPASFRIYMQVRSDDATTLTRLQSFFAFAFSSQGDTLVSNTGLLPIPATSKIQMLSRLGATGGFNLNTVQKSVEALLHSINNSSFGALCMVTLAVFLSHY